MGQKQVLRLETLEEVVRGRIEDAETKQRKTWVDDEVQRLKKSGEHRPFLRAGRKLDLREG